MKNTGLPKKTLYGSEATEFDSLYDNDRNFYNNTLQLSDEDFLQKVEERFDYYKRNSSTYKEVPLRRCHLIRFIRDVSLHHKVQKEIKERSLNDKAKYQKELNNKINNKFYQKTWFIVLLSVIPIIIAIIALFKS